MSFLRVAAFDLAGSFDVWDSTLGEYLRNNPDCIAAKAASDGTTWLVATEWTTREAYEADLASAEFRKAFEAAATKLGFSTDIAPTFLFEGEIGARA
jgi:hypothetical protein